MSDPIETTLQLLLDERDIRNLYFRYARGIDRMDAELLRGCLHEDGTVTTANTEVRDDFVRNVMGALKPFKMTQHQTSNILIEVDGDTARGEAYVQANHRAPGHNGEPDTDYRWGGRYVDRFEKRNGEWRFTSRIMLHDMDWVAKVDEVWDPPGLGITEGSHSTDDLVYK